jgi:hypothetical protein
MGFRDNVKRRQAEIRAASDQRELQKSGDSLEKYGLDINAYSEEQIRIYNAHNIQKIRKELAGNGLLKAGLLLVVLQLNELG